MGLVGRLHALSPTLVGGCRAIDLSSALDRESWHVIHHAIVSKWAIPSEVLIAARVPEGAP
jgi:hypothetical protein